VTAATEAKTMMVSALKTEAKGTTAVMKMITSVSTPLSLLVMPKGTMVLTRAITVVLAATVLYKVTATEAKALAVGLIAKVLRMLPLTVFVLHPLSCQH
jgi:hypothetical protein